MQDDQNRVSIKRIIIFSIILIILGAAGIFYRVYTSADYSKYLVEKQQEETIKSQVDALQAETDDMALTIEDSGKQLVSFTEDKIKYINLASELSMSCGVSIGKLSVSDIWQEGQMSVITSSIEVDGELTNIKQFVDNYCGIDYANRIKVISCRPTDRYPWLARNIDGERVLNWFDLAEEDKMFKDIQSTAQTAAEDLGVVATTDKVETPITLSKMFAQRPFKVYLVIDFLGRV